jgi:hypothetical protein
MKAGNIVAADVNRDGRSDLLIPSGRSLNVLLSEDERFRAAQESPIRLPDPAGEIAVGDVNGDDKPDIAVASHDSYNVTVLLGDGSGRFEPARGSPFVSKRGEHPHTHGLGLGDFNNDAKLDIVTANNDDDDLSIMLGDGKGAFAPAPRSPFPCGRSPYPIAVADTDGDGNLDVLVPNSVPPDAGIKTLTMLRGSGKGDLSPAPISPLKIAGRAFYAATGDLNSDGKPDAVVTHNEEDSATVLMNDGRGGFTPARGSPLKLGENAWGAAIADMDRDGKADIVVAAKDAVRVFLGDGQGTFRPAPGSPFFTGKGTWRLAVGDFNADSKPDVAATCLEDGYVAILTGR